MITERQLAVVCDGLRLPNRAYIPESPRGVVVLLHGIPSTGPPDPDDGGYPELARRFAGAGWTAVWANLRGARGSPGHFSIEGWVRDVRAVADAARSLPGPRVAIVGSSAGGAVAVEAVVRGARADALALLATPAAWVSFAGDAREGARRITQEAGMTLAPESLADLDAWAQEFITVTTETSIASVRIPVLILHGTHDDVVPVHHAHRLAERAPGAELRILPGAPHQLRRHPGVFELVLDWLNFTLA
jgi:alpha-beta hydrolase superfamily lysophospholipase